MFIIVYLPQIASLHFIRPYGYNALFLCSKKTENRKDTLEVNIFNRGRIKRLPEFYTLLQNIETGHMAGIKIKHYQTKFQP